VTEPFPPTTLAVKVYFLPDSPPASEPPPPPPPPPHDMKKPVINIIVYIMTLFLIIYFLLLNKPDRNIDSVLMKLYAIVVPYITY